MSATELDHLRQLSSFEDIEAWIVTHIPRLIRPKLPQNARTTKFQFVRKMWCRSLYGRDARAAGLETPADATGHVPFVGWKCEAQVVFQGGSWWDAAIVRELGFIPLRDWCWLKSPVVSIEFLMTGSDWVPLSVMEKLRG